METVGQFDEHSADVVAHGVEQLPKVVLLLIAIGQSAVFAFGLGDHPHEKSHFRAEAGADVVVGAGRVFHHIVEKGRDDGTGVHAELFGHDACHRYRVHDVGFARLAVLVGMGLCGKLKRLLYPLQVGLWKAFRKSVEHLPDRSAKRKKRVVHRGGNEKVRKLEDRMCLQNYLKMLKSASRCCKMCKRKTISSVLR